MPKETFEKVSEISEEYLEISRFETDSSSFKIGGRKINQVDKGIYCYINTQKEHTPIARVESLLDSQRLF